MERTRRFFWNAILLSAVNMLMRAAAVSFNAYVTGKIGAESMGLFTLVMNVYGFAVTVATSAVNLAAVRLTAERCAVLEEQNGGKGDYRYAMARVGRAVCLYGGCFGLLTGAALFGSAEVIANRLLRDGRTLLSLRVLAVSLPAISLSSALSGYFTGVRKAAKNALLSVTEQGVKILVTTTALVLVTPFHSVEYACLAVVGGSAVSEAASAFFCFFLFLLDSKRPSGVKAGEKDGVKLDCSVGDAAQIALPTAFGAYLRQGLNTAEHLALPAGLRKRGASSSEALASYGVLHGMAFPLVMFPYAVIHSFTGLLIPEVAASAATGDDGRVRSIVRRVFRCTVVSSVGAAGFFALFADVLGMAIYQNAEAGHFIRVMGLLVPFMYLDTVCDAILKGLGEQVYIMKVNTVDAMGSLILVVLLTPVIGLYGYVLTVWASEILNLTAGLARLHRVMNRAGTEEETGRTGRRVRAGEKERDSGAAAHPAAMAVRESLVPATVCALTALLLNLARRIGIGSETGLLVLYLTAYGGWAFFHLRGTVRGKQRAKA